MPNFLELSYDDTENSKPLDDTITSLANKYLGSTSGLNVSSERRHMEFLFPHFEQVSLFIAELHVHLPQVSVDMVA